MNIELVNEILKTIGGCETSGCSMPCSCAAAIRQDVVTVIRKYESEGLK